MITRSHRFHGLNSLRHVYTHGRTMRAGLFAVKSELNPRRAGSNLGYRAAVVVSRKVHKSAVVRNRIRRRVYEILRRHEAEIRQPFDIVVTIFSEEVATMDAGVLEAAAVDVLSKAGILTASDNSLATGAQRQNHAIVEKTDQPRPKERS